MRGIIYCIKEKEKGYDSPIYIGSTKDFKRRELAYKDNINCNTKECNTKLYQYIINNRGWDNFDMIEIGVIHCETNEDLKIEEQKWIDDLGASLNTYRAYVSLNQKKEADRKSSKKTYHKNKKKIFCECGAYILNRSLINHLKTKKHKTYEKNLNKDFN
jgi:hypothetical protein